MKKNNLVAPIIVIILAVSLGLYFRNQDNTLTEYEAISKTEAADCTPLKKKFDEYIEKIDKPILDDPTALCYGMNMGINFETLAPKWAIGKLISIKKEFQHTLEFKGFEKTGLMPIPLTENEVIRFKIGQNYKIDMQNICRHFFMLADSRYVSPIAETFVKPEKISCK